ncbi:hypothetical protein cyc_07183 [Cyclospora cayetanensis]|uniref:Uncharacterized protein n=1 Tax=Cyclospora cayetanensis TaxID=88456 RepID=A0A1D3CWZ6_9EIME|nr:hypothetical protein cyc_07183 [Cyclospora cayetanensis]
MEMRATMSDAAPASLPLLLQRIRAEGSNGGDKNDFCIGASRKRRCRCLGRRGGCSGCCFFLGVRCCRIWPSFFTQLIQQLLEQQGQPSLTAASKAVSVGCSGGKDALQHRGSSADGGRSRFWMLGSDGSIQRILQQQPSTVYVQAISCADLCSEGVDSGMLLQQRFAAFQAAGEASAAAAAGEQEETSEGPLVKVLLLIHPDIWYLNSAANDAQHALLQRQRKQRGGSESSENSDSSETEDSRSNTEQHPLLEAVLLGSKAKAAPTVFVVAVWRWAPIKSLEDLFIELPSPPLQLLQTLLEEGEQQQRQPQWPSPEEGAATAVGEEGAEEALKNFRSAIHRLRCLALARHLGGKSVSSRIRSVSLSSLSRELEGASPLPRLRLKCVCDLCRSCDGVEGGNTDPSSTAQLQPRAVCCMRWCKLSFPLCLLVVGGEALDKFLLMTVLGQLVRGKVSADAPSSFCFMKDAPEGQPPCFYASAGEVMDATVGRSQQQLLLLFSRASAAGAALCLSQIEEFVGTAATAATAAAGEEGRAELQRDLAQMLEVAVQVYVHHLGVPLICTTSCQPHELPYNVARSFSQIIHIKSNKSRGVWTPEALEVEAEPPSEAG